MSFPKHTANILTIFRIVLIPIIVGIFYTKSPVGYIAASIFFLIACLTDYFDGLVARQANQVTSLGRFLDPIADKLLIASTLIMLAGFERIYGINLIPAVIILCREILVSGLREYLGALEVSMPVTRLAKWKTGFQMFGIGFLIVGDALPIFPFEPVGICALWFAAFLTALTGYSYLRVGLKHIS